jgi:hypothetical protein
MKPLEEDGWTRQFVASEPRLTEAVEMYKEAGFEVHLEPLPPAESENLDEDAAEGEECRRCFKGFEDQYKIIFTRPKKGKEEFEDDLF